MLLWPYFRVVGPHQIVLPAQSRAVGLHKIVLPPQSRAVGLQQIMLSPQSRAVGTHKMLLPPQSRVSWIAKMLLWAYCPEWTFKFCNSFGMNFYLVVKIHFEGTLFSLYTCLQVL